MQYQYQMDGTMVKILASLSFNTVQSTLENSLGMSCKPFPFLFKHQHVSATLGLVWSKCQQHCFGSWWIHNCSFGYNDFAQYKRSRKTSSCRYIHLAMNIQFEKKMQYFAFPLCFCSILHMLLMRAANSFYRPYNFTI